MSDKSKVLLIGLGGIGCKYDYPEIASTPFTISDNSKSHLGAILGSGMTLIGGIDADENSRNLFEKYSSTPTWDSLANFPKNIDVDLVVISTPTSTHRDVFQQVIDCIEPKGLIIEKPFGLNAIESAYMLDLATAKGIPVRVNYSRNYSEGFRKIQEELGSDDLVSGHVLYSQGLRPNGSHFVRLILGLFGQPISVTKNNSSDLDLNPSFTFFFNNGSFIRFTGSNSAYVRTAEIILETENFSLHIQEGMEFRLTGLDKDSNLIKWPMQLDLITAGNLDGGIRQIYSDLGWLQEVNYRKQIELNILDAKCNEIIDELLL